MYEVWYNCIKPKYQDRAKIGLWILAALLFMLKPKIFIKILLMMSENDLTHLTMIIVDRFQLVKTKK